MRTLKFEMNRAFHGKWLYISILLGTIIAALDLGLFRIVYGSDKGKVLIQAWLGTNYQFVYNSLFYVLMPLFACLPYAGTYFSDMDSGYDRNICVKTSRFSYMMSKCVASFASGFVAVSIPLLLDLYGAAGLYPDGKPDKLSFLTAGIIDSYLFPELFNGRPWIYILLFIFIDGMFAGLFAVMSVCISRWSRNRFSAVMFPFVVYVLTGVVLDGVSDGCWSVLQMVNPEQPSVTYMYQMVVVYMFTACVSVMVTWFYSRRRDVL